MKKLIKVAVVLVVLVVIVVAAVFFYIDRIARIGVEKGGTYALGVPTKLEKADVGVFSGTFAMSGLSVANPPGFEAPYFLQLNDGGVAVSLASLRRDTVELPKLGLDGLEIELDRRGDKPNYATILDNLKRFESKGESVGGKDEPGKRFVVREIDIRNVTIRVYATSLGGDLSALNVPIEQIRLTDVGTGSDNGVGCGELIDIIVKAVFAAIIQKGGGLIPSDIMGGLQSGMAQLQPLADRGVTVTTEVGQRFQAAAEEITKQLKGAGDAFGGVGDEAKKAADGITDLFKKK